MLKFFFGGIAAVASLVLSFAAAPVMADNAIYPNYKEALLTGAANTDMAAGTVKAVLVDTGTYTYSAAHTFLSDLTGTVGTAVALSAKTFTDGNFDSADVTWSGVTGATAEAIVLYLDTGSDASSRLILILDTAQTGLPVTPNGGDVSYTVGAKWFGL